MLYILVLIARAYIVFGLITAIYLTIKVYGNYFKKHGLSDRKENRYIFGNAVNMFFYWPLYAFPRLFRKKKLRRI